MGLLCQSIYPAEVGSVQEQFAQYSAIIGPSLEFGDEPKVHNFQPMLWFSAGFLRFSEAEISLRNFTRFSVRKSAKISRESFNLFSRTKGENAMRKGMSKTLSHVGDAVFIQCASRGFVCKVVSTECLAPTIQVSSELGLGSFQSLTKKISAHFA